MAVRVAVEKPEGLVAPAHRGKVLQGVVALVAAAIRAVAVAVRPQLVEPEAALLLEMAVLAVQAA
jgi:hypothetical protein